MEGLSFSPSTFTFSPSTNSVSPTYSIEQNLTTSHHSTPTTQAPIISHLVSDRGFLTGLSACTLVSSNMLNTAFRVIVSKREPVHVSSLHGTLQWLCFLAGIKARSPRSGHLPPSEICSVLLTHFLPSITGLNASSWTCQACSLLDLHFPSAWSSLIPNVYSAYSPTSFLFLLRKTFTVSFSILFLLPLKKPKKQNKHSIFHTSCSFICRSSTSRI